MTPTVSIIVPCYNEVETIGDLLDAISRQSYPVQQMEVIIADGGSTDGTQSEIEGFAAANSELSIRILDNPQRIIPAALNHAIAASKGKYIVRLDAHSAPMPDYIERSIQTLERTGAANVGGQWDIQPTRDTWIGRSIAAAAGHPLGAGGASYRIGGVEGVTDTVPFGVFRREWLERVGPFNERLLSNEDYEYNARIRAAGGVVWFDPTIRSIYYARGTLWELARQYARYGFWKARMLRSYPGTLKWRQALPPLFVLATPGLLVMSRLWLPSARVLAGAWAAYALLLIASAVSVALRRRDSYLMLGFPASVITMHLAWGAAFWPGLAASLFSNSAGRGSKG